MPDPATTLGNYFRPPIATLGGSSFQLSSPEDSRRSFSMLCLLTFVPMLLSLHYSPFTLEEKLIMGRQEMLKVAVLLVAVILLFSFWVHEEGC